MAELTGNYWEIWRGPGCALLVRVKDPDRGWLIAPMSNVALRMVEDVTPERAEEVFDRMCQRVLVPKKFKLETEDDRPGTGSSEDLSDASDSGQD